ncbi:MAG: porin [Gammaproteobacteria bacterium]|nr:porin [Gammaproteobacteria bacterium]
MKQALRKMALAAVCVGGVAVTIPVQAANWLMLQGTEPASTAGRAKVWGFIQPEYQQTRGSEIDAGPWTGQRAVFNAMRPDLKADKGFNTIRARVGVRGVGMPIDPKVNYFFLAEFGNNGITQQGGGSVKVTDASVTLNHIPGARIRVGTFKTPGSEEGLQAIHVFDYINFTGATNGLLLERFFNGNGSGTFVSPVAGPGTAADSGDANRPNGSVSAFRDTGVQVFDTFKQGSWEHAYAIMMGNGNGIARGENDDNKETYLYWSSERVYAGSGPRRQGWKMFAWKQSGKRTLSTEGAGEYNRDRAGLGTTYKKGRHRAAFEYITADGMIFNGTDGGAIAGSVSNLPAGAAGKFTGNTDAGGDGQVTASFNVEVEGEADGYYLHYGFAPNPRWEFDVRYDVYNRMTDVSAKERQFKTWTLGTQYFFNRKSRVIVNYEIRNAEAPNLPVSDNANKILSGMDNRFSAQLLIIF